MRSDLTGLLNNGKSSLRTEVNMMFPLCGNLVESDVGETRGLPEYLNYHTECVAIG